MQCYIDEELFQNLEKVKEILAKTEYDLSYRNIMRKLTDCFLTHKDPIRKAERILKKENGVNDLNKTKEIDQEKVIARELNAGK